MNKRINILKNRLMDISPAICSERAEIITKAYKENEGESHQIIRAIALQKILSEMSIYINDNELIVGNQASKPKAAPIFPEFSYDWILKELDTFESRTSDKFTINKDTKETLKEVLPYWKNKTTKDRALKIMNNKALECHNELVYILTALGSGLGHITVDYEKVLNIGMEGIIEEVNGKLEKIDSEDPKSIEKKLFYQSLLIVCKAVIMFSIRFSKLANKMANKEQDKKRKKELLQISDVCSKVPAKPADSFHEAIQSFWFIQLILQIESNGHSISPGRFDQYMYKYYKRDLENGILTEETAKELLSCLWIKFNEITKVRDWKGALAFGGYPMYQNLIVGGVDKEGNDATNDLTYLCLEVTSVIKMPQPSLSTRYNYNSPNSYLNKACELVKAGIGMPAFFNDEIIIPILTTIGVSLEDARDYAEVGCVEPQAPGKSEGLYSGGFMNLCKVLEITLNDGINPITGNKIGLSTGMNFNTYEDFYVAFKKQLIYFIELQALADNIIDYIHGEFVPTPLVSCLVNDCIKNTRDVRKGGAIYNYTSPNVVGLANTADSLAAIKKVVFEEKKISLYELVKILNNNFEGYEDLRQYLINKIPKYGNDIEYVDSIARKVGADYCNEFRSKQNIRNGTFQPGLQSISAHALFVGSLGATPDGRKKEDLVSDGGVSPAQGRDKNGPTAIINSVAALDHLVATNGTLLNIKFHPTALEGNAGINNIVSLIKTFFSKKGQHVQFNVLSSDTLREAQKTPDKYKDLVVRVAGFSVYFTDIDKVLQNDIIERTEQGTF